MYSIRKIASASLCGIWLSLSCAHSIAAILPDGDLPPADMEIFDPTATNLPSPQELEINESLHLEALVNNEPTGLIVSVTPLQDGGFAMRREDIQALRIAIVEGAADEEIPLTEIDALTYIYDESRQRLEINLPADQLQTTRLDAKTSKEALKPIDPPLRSLVLNYSANLGGSYKPQDKSTAFEGASISLDARAASSLGILRQTGILQSKEFSTAKYTRLDTSFSKNFTSYNVTARAGDVYSGSLPWTRSLRLGGFQLQRDFSLRPGLITMPLPIFSGTANLPSTLDVYVKNSRTYSTELPAGPFSISNVPVLTGAGKARFILRDATGQEHTSEADFFTSPDMLAPGLMDFSAEAGFARLDTGTKNFGYGNKFIASLTSRYGISDRITVMGHTELGAGLVNASLGARINLADWGMLTLASGASYDKSRGTGGLGHLSYEKQIGIFGFTLGTTRIFGNYRDLADATQRELTADEEIAGYVTGTTARVSDQLMITAMLPWEGGSMGAGLINVEDSGGQKSTIATLNFAQAIAKKFSINASSFMDFRSRNYGLMAGISWKLGETSSVASSITAAKNRVNANLGYFASGKYKDNDWRFSASRGQGDRSSTQANVSYQTSKANLRGNIHSTDEGELSSQVAADGAITLASGGIYSSAPIYDAFAIVEANAPNIRVFSENREIGKTNKSGRILIPNLRGYEMNYISIDPEGLPLEASVPVTSMSVRPQRGSGVLVPFGVKEKSQSALIVLHDAQGKPIELGAEAVLSESSEKFTIGYDGETYIEGLEDQNIIQVITSEGQCTASFAYQPESQSPVIGPVPCI